VNHPVHLIVQDAKIDRFGHDPIRSGLFALVVCLRDRVGGQGKYRHGVGRRFIPYFANHLDAAFFRHLHIQEDKIKAGLLLGGQGVVAV